MKFRKKYIWVKKCNRMSRNEYLQAIRRFAATDEHEEDDTEYYRTNIWEYREERKDSLVYANEDPTYKYENIYPY